MNAERGRERERKNINKLFDIFDTRHKTSHHRSSSSSSKIHMSNVFDHQVTATWLIYFYFIRKHLAVERTKWFIKYEYVKKGYVFTAGFEFVVVPYSLLFLLFRVFSSLLLCLYECECMNIWKRNLNVAMFCKKCQKVGLWRVQKKNCWKRKMLKPYLRVVNFRKRKMSRNLEKEEFVPREEKSSN